MSILHRFFTTLGHALHGFGFFVWEWLFILWRRPAFLPVMWRLWEWSFFHSPYRLSYRSREAEHYDLTYGEVALPTVDKILDQLNLQPHDRLLDLGSGRGRVVLLAATRGIPAEGVEIVEGLVKTARYAAGAHLPLATFTQADFLTVDFSQATVIWAAGTCWSQTTREQLTQKLLQLTPGTWIVSITRPFPHPDLPVRHTIRGWTSWGRDHYYLQQVST